MKADFYRKSKKINIYNRLYAYKIVSLIIFIIMTLLLSIFYNRSYAAIKEPSDYEIPPIFYAFQVLMVLFICSILLDFYIIHRIASIGRRLNKMAYIDKLTGLPNRFSCDLIFDSFNTPEKLPTVGFILIKLDNLNNVNKENGHAGGNNLIAEFCSIFEDVGHDYGYVGRNGGNEFMIIMENSDSTNIELFLMDLAKRIQGYNELNPGEPIELAYSRVLNCDENLDNVSKIISLAYRRFNEMPQVLS